jgi:hypothetical protein
MIDAYIQTKLDETGEQLLKFFKADHLPTPLAAMSEKFGLLACAVVDEAPRSAERTVALRKLLESKDAAVRALLP